MEGMNTTTSLISPSHILLDVPMVSSKKRLLETIAAFFQDSTDLPQQVVFDALFARERLGSTALGHGVAIPHGRIPGLDRVHTAFLRLENPIAYDAPDGAPVQLCFCLLVPIEATQAHLDLLASIAQKLSRAEVRERLMMASSAEAIAPLLAL